MGSDFAEKLTMCLWSSLILSETTHQIKCPQNLQVSLEEFVVALREQIRRNSVSAQVDLCGVRWDDESQTARKISIRPAKDKVFSDVILYIVDLSNEGVFTHLGEKLVVTPPPDVRAKQSLLPYEEYPESSIANELDLRVAGLTLVVISVLFVVVNMIVMLSGNSVDKSSFLTALLLGALGGILIPLNPLLINRARRKDEERKRETEALNAATKQKNQSITDSNAAADREYTLRDVWFQQVKQFAIAQRTENPVGKWSSAISSTVQQVIDDLFIGRQAKIQSRTEQSKGEQEIADEIEKRRQEAFG